MLRRLKDQVLDDLPPKIEQTVKIEFDPDEAAFYEVIRKQAIEKLEGDDAETNMGKRKLQILAEMSKLRRACCHPSLVEAPGEYEGAKNKEFFSLVTSLKANQHRALVFSQYTSYLKLLRGYLDMMDINYLYLDGSTPAKKRKELVNQFQEGGHDLFLLSLKAGGSGLNLTNADYVIHLDPWWNPAVEDQATDRAHRIGQQKTVNVYRLIMKASIEEKILQLHDTKRELADELLDEANISAKLSDKELLEMMRG
jgi:SNF2 family DNA or RNA helicase